MSNLEVRIQEGVPVKVTILEKYNIIGRCAINNTLIPSLQRTFRWVVEKEKNLLGIREEISSHILHFWEVDFQISEVSLGTLDKQSMLRDHRFNEKPPVLYKATLTQIFFFEDTAVSCFPLEEKILFCSTFPGVLYICRLHTFSDQGEL